MGQFPGFESFRANAMLGPARLTGTSEAMVETAECAVIGAGVVGLAVARALALAGHEVLVLESSGAIGTGISARSSEVIHAGMYYPTDSWKAKLCIQGNRLLRHYLQERHLPHRMLGKLIVACDQNEEAQLQKIFDQGRLNDTDGLCQITTKAALEMEPALHCRAALFSPATGILDSHAYMLALQADLESRGGLVAFQSPVLSVEADGNRLQLTIGGPDPSRLCCRRMVNAAGLGAVALAKAIVGLPAESVPSLHLCKGNYFLLSGRRPFQRLVYPIPESAGIGIHFTLDLAGQGRFGPDVEWSDRLSYDVDPQRGEAFYARIRRYWPGLPDGALRPGYAGIRPKITAPGQAAADFRIEGPDRHGIPGLINLFGIESPGLTASLALANHVTELLQ